MLKNLKCFALSLIIGMFSIYPLSIIYAKEYGKKAQELKQEKIETEKTGLLEVRAKEMPEKSKGKAKGRGKIMNEFILKADGVEYKLLCSSGKGKGKGKGSEITEKLISLNGKIIAVKGKLLPANPPKYPLAAIIVNDVNEVQAQQQATQQPTTPSATTTSDVTSPTQQQ